MDFQLSDDQRMLQDSVQRLMADAYGLERRLAYMATPEGWSSEVWGQLVELGLTMLPFSEDHGGLGLGGVEMLIVGEAFGRGLVVEPYLPSIVMAGTAIAEGAGDRAAELLEPIMAGTAIGALADLAHVVKADSRLTGSAQVVLGGDSATCFIIPGADCAWIVPADAVGLTVRPYRLHGGGGAADLTLNGVDISQAVRLPLSAVTRAIEAGIAFLAAEAAGAIQAGLDGVVEYLKTREQFGKPIGTNQALQHRAAEMLVEVEQARSAAIYAALLSGEPDVDLRSRGMAAVKAVIGKAGRFVAQNIVQLYGGIGVSEEHVASHYFRRLTAIGQLLGSTEQQLGKLARSDGFTGASAHFDS